MKIPIPIKNLNNLKEAVKTKLDLPGHPEISYFSEKRKRYLVVDTLEDLPDDAETLKVEIQVPLPWEWKPDSSGGWLVRGYDLTQYHSLLLIENGKAAQTAAAQLALDKLRPLMTNFGGSIGQVKKAFAIHNPQLINAFETNRKGWIGKLREHSALFIKEDWRSLPEADVRRAFLDHLTDYSRKFPLPPEHSKVS